MSADVMTFGEFLNAIIKSKNISATKLAEITGMKSRNSIQRILKDESSINVIEAFKTKLIELDPLELSPSEQEQLEQSIEVSKVGKDTFGARRILLQVFDNSIYRVKTESPIAFNPLEQKSISLRELFTAYKTASKISLLVFDAVSADFMNELLNLIRTSPPGLISISQIIYLGYSRSHNAESLVTVLKFVNYENYDVYYIDSQSIDTHSTIAPNSIIIDKETSGGDHYTDLIKMDSGQAFSFVNDIPGNSLYLFYLYQFNRLKGNAQKFKRIYEKQNPFNTVLNICDLTIPLRENTNRYLVEHGLHYPMIPYDILINMMVESDYFGMDSNNPIIQKLKQVLYDRFYAYYYIDTLKVNFFTKHGLFDFVKNKVLADQFCYLRPFTAEEVKAILEFILEQLEEKDFFKIFLLKSDLSIGNIQFSYFENKALWIFDASSGYNESYFEGYIDSTPILEVYDDFIKNELMRNHVLPEFETIEYLKYLISII